MIVLDATVLVYAKGADHSFRDPCRKLVSLVTEGAIEATTSVEAIQEFVHVRAKRRSRQDAAEIGRDYTDLLSPLLDVTRDDLLKGLALFERSERLGAFDAVLAAAAVARGADALVSADADFATVAGLTHVVPDRAGVEGLLATG